jgi:HIRAN domain
MKSYSIVGMEFRKAVDIVAALQPGTIVTLVREPTNQYDPNAIAVWVEGKHVGYIPKKQNAVLAQFIDQTGSDAPIDGELALDQSIAAIGRENIKAVAATFIRSPNSGYPMVQVDGGPV